LLSANQIWKQRKELEEKKVENCAWTTVVDKTMLNTTLVGILLKMVMLKFLFVPRY